MCSLGKSYFSRKKKYYKTDKTVTADSFNKAMGDKLGFEKDAQQNDTEIIRVRYLKCRSIARHASFYVKYSEEQKGLVLADPKEVAGVIKKRQLKANEDDIIESIEEYLGNGEEMAQEELFKKLLADYEVGPRTLEKRIVSISDPDTEIYDKKGDRVPLVKELKGNILHYKLSPSSQRKAKGLQVCKSLYSPLQAANVFSYKPGYSGLFCWSKVSVKTFVNSPSQRHCVPIYRFCLYALLLKKRGLK